MFQLESAQEKCEKVVKVSISQLGLAYFSTSCTGSQFDPPFKAYHSIFQRSVILNEDIGRIICAKKASTPKARFQIIKMEKKLQLLIYIYIFDPPLKAYHCIFQRGIILNEFYKVISMIICAKKLQLQICIYMSADANGRSN